MEMDKYRNKHINFFAFKCCYYNLCNLLLSNIEMHRIYLVDKFYWIEIIIIVITEQEHSFDDIVSAVVTIFSQYIQRCLHLWSSNSVFFFK